MQSNFTPLVNTESENTLFKSDDSENYQKPKTKFNFVWIILGTIGIIFTIFAIFFVYTQPNKIKAFSAYFLNSSGKSKNNINSLISQKKIIPTPTIVPPTPTPTPDPFPGWLSFKTDKIIFRYPPDLVVRNQAGEGSTDYTNLDIKDLKTENMFDTRYFHISSYKKHSFLNIDDITNNRKTTHPDFKVQNIDNNSKKTQWSGKYFDTEIGKEVNTNYFSILKEFDFGIVEISSQEYKKHLNEELLDNIASTITSILPQPTLNLNKTPTPTFLPIPTIESIENWKSHIYYNLMSFKYPSNFIIYDPDNSTTMSITSPNNIIIQAFYTKCWYKKFSFCPDYMSEEYKKYPFDGTFKKEYIANNGIKLSGYTSNGLLYKVVIIYSFEDETFSLQYSYGTPAIRDVKTIEDIINTITFVGRQPLKRKI